MTVTAAAGFRAAGVAAGLRNGPGPDVALVVNDGPLAAAAGVVTRNRVKAAPVLWTEEVLRAGRLRAVVLNAGGANACTGPAGFADTHRTAERVAAGLGCGAAEVAVCSTGLIGAPLAVDQLLAGVDKAVAELSGGGGDDAAEAIRTTDTRAKTAVVRSDGVTFGGMAKGAGMLAPGLATMLCVLTTDAVATPADLDAALRAVSAQTFDRLDADGCMSTNDTVLVLASGASGRPLPAAALEVELHALCTDLSRQLLADAEGASKQIDVRVVGARTVDDAVDVARSVARSNLFKCAVHGADPNWGRVLAAIGTTDAEFDPTALDVAINGVWVCRSSTAAAARDAVDMSGAEVVVTVDLHAGAASGHVWTTDLTAAYVHENSAYST
jgi:glutamate N-acetyltransferase/amino-acid N-acetyltransferase